MGGWTEFISALVVFLLSHMIPVRPPMRPLLIRALGLRGYFLGYSLLSVLVLVWMIVAAGRAPYVEVIPPLEMFRWGPLIVMPVVCVLAVAGISSVNPLSFGGLGRGAFDPTRPGILAVSRHPLLLALLIWSLVHLLTNGDLAHVLLFGMFAGFAGIGMALIDRRKRRELGPEVWQGMAQNTARLSLSGEGRVRLGLWQWGVSAGVFAVLLWAHLLVIGVSPLP
ncbi:MAG: putative membrane protein [Paracoccaceae bacterium]|jgi:uncharacterized membrane protein